MGSQFGCGQDLWLTSGVLSDTTKSRWSLRDLHHIRCAAALVPELSMVLRFLTMTNESPSMTGGNALKPWEV